ncbi:MAG: EamA family transporter [Acidobacteriaceae bacterium]
MQRRHIAGYSLLCLIWGSTWLAIRVVVQTVPPLRAVTLRFALAAALLALFIAMQRLPMPRHREMRGLLALALGMMALPYALVFWAERLIPSSTTAVLFASLPLFTALFTRLMSEGKVPRRAVYAMAVGAGGILVMFSGALSASFATLMGGIAVLAAVALSAWATVFAKLKAAGVNPMVSTAVQLGLGALLLMPACLLMERGEHAQWSHTAVAAMGFLIVFGSVVAFSVYYWLLREIEPYQIATVQLVVPVVAIAEGALLGHERVPFSVLAAAALILGSVAVALRARANDEAMLSVRMGEL